MEQQNKKFNFDLSESEVGWLIESLEYYLAESETTENETYNAEVESLLGRILKNYRH